MTSDQLLPALLGFGLLCTPALRYWVRTQRAARKAKDAETHQSFMDFLDRMRQAGDEQEADPRVAAIVARFEYSVNGGVQPGTRTGRHRAVTAGGRHRLAATA